MYKSITTAPVWHLLSRGTIKLIHMNSLAVVLKSDGNQYTSTASFGKQDTYFYADDSISMEAWFNTKFATA